MSLSNHGLRDHKALGATHFEVIQIVLLAPRETESCLRWSPAPTAKSTTDRGEYAQGIKEACVAQIVPDMSAWLQDTTSYLLWYSCLFKAVSVWPYATMSIQSCGSLSLSLPLSLSAVESRGSSSARQRALEAPQQNREPSLKRHMPGTNLCLHLRGHSLLVVRL